MSDHAKTSYAADIDWAWTTGRATMRKTTDLMFGKTFRWNCTATEAESGLIVPARCTDRVSTHLHSLRTPIKLLVKLNGQAAVDAWMASFEDTYGMTYEKASNLHEFDGSPDD